MIAVRDGQRVKAGQPLALVRPGETLTGGGTAGEGARAALQQQDSDLAGRAHAVSRAAAADRGRLRAQIAGLRAELSNLATQIGDQERLVAIAQADLENVQAIARGGFVSRR